MFPRQAHRRQPRPLVDRPREHLPQRPHPFGRGPQRFYQAHPLRHLVQQPHRAHARPLNQFDPFEPRTLRQAGQCVFVLERPLDHGDLRGVAVGEIEQRAVFDLRARGALRAVALPQENLLVAALADVLRHTGHVHNGYHYARITHKSQA